MSSTGPAALKRMLKGTHFTGSGKLAGQKATATYKLMAYDKVTQSPDRGVAGTIFNKKVELFNIGNHTGWYVVDGKYAAMAFGGGDAMHCPGNKPRSSYVGLVCAPNAGIVGKVEEPSPCMYNLTFGLPAICGVDMAVGHEDAPLRDMFIKGTGPDKLHDRLTGKTFTASGVGHGSDNHFKYTLQPYVGITQTPLNGTGLRSLIKSFLPVSAGKFTGWYVLNGNWTTMVFEGGDACAGGEKRRTNVTLVCGSVAGGSIVGPIQEPRKCSYSMTLGLPQMCDADVALGHEEGGVKPVAPPRFLQPAMHDTVADAAAAVVAQAQHHLRRSDAVHPAVLMP